MDKRESLYSTLTATPIVSARILDFDSESDSSELLCSHHQGSQSDSTESGSHAKPCVGTLVPGDREGFNTGKIYTKYQVLLSTSFLKSLLLLLRAIHISLDLKMG